MKDQTKTKKRGIRTGFKIAFKVTKELIVLAITLVMVFVALLLIVNRDRWNLDAVKRWITYSSLEKNTEGQTEEFLFSGDSSNRFAALDGGLLLCSNHALALYSSSGEEVFTQGVNMKNPVVRSNGSYAVAYDAGGTYLCVFHDNEMVYDYSASKNCEILSANINDSGYFALVEQTAGHKATVTVYDNHCQPRIGINESTNFVTDAVISDDSKYVALIEIYQDDVTLGGSLVAYQLSDASSVFTTRLNDQVVIDMQWKDNRIWLQQEYGVCVLDSKGTILDTWSDSGKYLERYSLGGDGFAVELLSKYRSGSAGELRVIDDAGQQSVSRSVSEEVLSISAAGRYIAVLTTGSLTVYTEDLREYASVANDTARRAIMREDGSVLLIGTEKARLFIP